MTAAPPVRDGQPGTEVIRLRDASFGYGDRRVLTGVDLSIRTGEVVALVGPNGAGKSTLVKGLLGLAATMGGTVDLFGQPRAELSPRTLVGYVPQRHTLANSVTATAAEIVATGLVAGTPWWQPWRLRGGQAQDRVEDALATVGLSDHARDDVATLSGGQQRRVLIARALAAGPRLFILDEPTAGVDVGHQRVLATVLQRLVDRGSTLLIVTHEIDALAPVITRTVAVRAGRVSLAEAVPTSGHDPACGDPAAGHPQDGSPRVGRPPVVPSISPEVSP